jgi:GDP-4-dehydro-6-deoxy-D-mannose reductase
MTDQPVVETQPLNPVSAYGCAKRDVTMLGQQAASRGLRVVEARPFNVVGAGTPDWLVAGALVERVRAAVAPGGTRRAHVGTTSAIRDFVDVRDVASGIVAIARRGISGETYNVCTGLGRPVSDVVWEIVRLAGGGVEVTSDPALMVAGEVDAMVGSSRKLAALGWTARHTLEDALADAWNAAGAQARDEVTPR